MKTKIILLMGLISITVFAQEDALPEKVEMAFHTKYPKNTKLTWTKDVDLFYLEYYISSRMFTSIFNESGNWIETAEVIADTDIPISLQNYITENYPEASVSYVEKVDKPGGESNYRVNMEDLDGSFIIQADLNGGNIKVQIPE